MLCLTFSDWFSSAKAAATISPDATQPVNSSCTVSRLPVWLLLPATLSRGALSLQTMKQQPRLLPASRAAMSTALQRTALGDSADEHLRDKKRKPLDEIMTYLD